MELLVIFFLLAAAGILNWWFGMDSREPERVFPPDP